MGPRDCRTETMNTTRAPESLSPLELESIATLWRRSRREFVTCFNGSSMLPAIAPAQQVIVECGVEPAPGDIIVFRSENQVRVHRLVARTATWLLTWGDANPLPDDPIEPMRVIGIVHNVPAAPRSLRRAILLRLLVSPRLPLNVLSRRVRRFYGMRAAWAQGPLVFAGKALRAVFR